MFVINATDYAPIDPLTPPCDVNQINIGYVGENHARCLVFDLTECVAQFGEGGFAISFIRHGDYLPYLVTDTDRLENNAIWLINSTDTAVEGYGMVQLQYIVGTTVVKSALYQTVTFASNEIPGNVPDPYEDLLTQIAAYAAQAEGAATTATAAAQTASTAVENGIKTERSQRIAADNGLQDQITAIRGAIGAPEMASSSTDFVETNKIYVYTGNEPGYTFGNWYYYNGAEWVSGGVYNATAFETDKTLTVEDMAADAKVTGDRINAAFVTEQASGTLVKLDDGADGMPLKTLAANVNALWAGSGNPTPSNPRPLTGFNKARIAVTGKNLIQLTDGTTTSTDTTFTQSSADGSVTVNGTSASQRFVNINFTAGKCNLPKGVPIKVSGGGNDTGLIVRICATNPITGVTANLFQSSVASPVTVGTVPEFYETVWVRVLSAASTTYENTTIYPMVTIAEDDTTFEVGSRTEYNVSFGAAGTVYGATLDIKSGMLTVTKSLATYNGSETWTATATAHGFYMTRPSAWLLRSAITTNLFKEVPAGTGTANMNPWEVGWNTTGVNLLFMCDSTITTLAEWEAFLAANPLQIMYELANPVSYQLSPTEVSTILGQNNIWCETGDITSLEYCADTKLYIEHLTSPDGDMEADANIANGSYFMVNNRLYIATAAIASGASIVPGTNCTETNLAAALNAINA